MNKELLLLLFYTAVGIFWIVYFLSNRSVSQSWADFVNFIFYILVFPLLLNYFTVPSAVGWVVLFVLGVGLMFSLLELFRRERYFFCKGILSGMRNEGIDDLNYLTSRFLYEERLEPAAIRFFRSGFFCLRGLTPEQIERYLHLLDEEYKEEFKKNILIWRLALSALCVYVLVRLWILYFMQGGH